MTRSRGRRTRATTPSPTPAALRPHRTFLALLALAFVLQIAGFWSLRHDDAYISFRYAQNLAQGHGMRFNPDESVMGSTSPGHVFVGAALYRLLGKDALPTAMSVLGCLGWALQALAAERLLRRALGPLASAAIGLAVAAGLARQGDWVALETNLALAAGFWTLALARLEPRRPAWAGLVGGVAILMRPDAILWVGFAGLAILTERGPRSRRDALVFVAAALPGIAVAVASFGGIVPRSAAVKMASTTPFAYAAAAVAHVGNVLLPAGGLAGAIAAWVAILWGTATLLRADRRLWPLAAVGGAHLAAYSLIAPPPEHVWHLVPAVLLAGICALALAGSLRSRAGPVLLAVAVALTLLRSAVAARSHPNEQWFGARDRAYRAVADYLRESVAPGDRVVAGEPGTIAYWSELPVEDAIRLVSGSLDAPEAGERRRRVRWVVMVDRDGATGPQAPTHWIELPHWRIGVVHLADGLPERP